MLAIFTKEFPSSLAQNKMRKTILSFPEMPMGLIRYIEDLELKSVEILQEIELGRVYGSISTRGLYFAWDLPFVPSIGWMFCAPVSMELGDSLATISNIYFGSGDTLLCEYE